MSRNVFYSSLFNEESLSAAFEPAYFARGKAYQLEGRVSDCHYNDDTDRITALVKGSQGKVYRTSVFVEKNGNRLSVHGACSCPIGYLCKHVVATLLEFLQQIKTSISHPDKNISDIPMPTNRTITEWLDQVANANKSVNKAASVKVENYLFVFVLSLHQMSYMKTPQVKIKLGLTRKLKKGGYGKPKKYSTTAESQQQYLTEVDKQLVFKLAFESSRGNVHSEYFDSSFILSDEIGNELLEEILLTGKCFFDDDGELSGPLSLGQKRKISLHWHMQPDGVQAIQTNLKEVAVLDSINPCCYYDAQKQVVGELVSEIPYKLLSNIMHAPDIPPEHAGEVYKQINDVNERLFSNSINNKLPAPKQFSDPRYKKDIKPVPCLRLKSIELEPEIYRVRSYSDKTLEVAAAKLGFYYQNHFVEWNDSKEVVFYLEKNNLFFAARQFHDETEAMELFDNCEHCVQVDSLYFYNAVNKADKFDWVIGIDESEGKLMSVEAAANNFILNSLPKFQELGWIIEFDKSFPYRYIDESEIAWYADLEESEYNWFEFKLGIQVEGESINLLPFLAEYLAKNPNWDTDDHKSDEKITVRLNDGRLLPIPMERVKGIIDLLTELYDGKSLNELGALKLSKMRLMQMIELKKAFGAAQLRWLGSERLYKLACQLKNFKQIKKISIPESFNATLRPYQQDGLNWLQFLRQYDLSGILADDMGLGKTVQALANFVVEKREKRLTLPSLIVMPTSLVTNWELEAKRFAPELTLLKLHGSERHDYFPLLSEYDLVFTTYPLIVRDKEKLLKQNFYYLILDEAQFVKNPKAKSTLILQQLTAKHRLCLTGTPMENHLGELWSLMHFLMPGFLGDQDQFRHLFRIPIEKEGDKDRQNVLSQRVKPFILCRKKNEVVKELPEKTNIIQYVDIEGSQRDLYETIRVAMNKKISQVIKQQGLSKSHIIILDALLKLRQVCCDPRLVKLDAAKKAHDCSAKLDVLMEMLPNLIEEGRRILLFSQFTSMISIIEDELHEKNIQYVKLTGDTNNRKDPIMRFQNKEVPVFLISLKAGGTGLNLTAADTVIHYDPWWNPAVEDQATDRAHRIGQTNSVFVYKLIVKGTMEETILEMQKKKRDLLSGLLSTQPGTGFKLSKEDIDSLFKPLE